MRKRAWRGIGIAWAGLAATVLGAASCSDTQTCDGSCPNVADDYAVQSSTLSGDCGFTPWLVPPTVTLAQEAKAGRVTIELIDPVNQVPVRLAADLFVPGPDEDTDAVAVLRGFQRAVRQAVSSQGGLEELQLFFSGSVSESGGWRTLQLTLQTRPVFGASCVSRQFVVARGARLKAQ
ncbi:MAG TPA: hypothetical protein VGK67_12440 [Myxococcales bacterium]|jgi:hypothetical protein